MTEELPYCDLNGVAIWEHGHVPKKEFKGRCLSKVSQRAFDTDFTEDEIVKAKVIHGWTVTTDGGDGYCGGIEMVQHLTAKKPRGKKTYYGREIIDGPHEATYLEVGT